MQSASVLGRFSVHMLVTFLPVSSLRASHSPAATLSTAAATPPSVHSRPSLARS
ncbi:uncharacterized protein ARMOST_02509 [Armillaria ostoyae]|uniref:Uncharacterized protein n=1 Tax=Armillaria ostoyae TaxID=47428 RepID=A0A284QRW3_ARMOS|nr:uncharacterized protein ARMOST_02509 [Armillaria ostoyae]